MVVDLYRKRNERKVYFHYPVNGTALKLRPVRGRKLASFTGPNGRGIKVQEDNGDIRSFSTSKCVIFSDKT